MAPPEQDELKEQAARIKQAEEQAGLISKPSDPDSGASMARGYRIGTDFVATILAFIVLGWLIDKSLELTPWGLLASLSVGFGVAVLNLARAVIKTDNTTDGREPKKSNKE